jgi:hypothetical protein
MKPPDAFTRYPAASSRKAEDADIDVVAGDESAYHASKSRRDREPPTVSADHFFQLISPIVMP